MGDRGYALPLVLIAIMVLLLFAGESATRVSREARLARIKENAEIAYFAAETGFFRVRARLETGAGDVTDANGIDKVRVLEGRSFDVSLPDGTQAHYLLEQVDAGSGEYYVTSVGTYGKEPFQARRIVRGRLWITGPSTSTPNYYVVQTQLDP